jgi:hypothetical protein
LKKESKVVFPKSFTLHRSILIKHIATVREDILSTIHVEFCKKMDCTVTRNLPPHYTHYSLADHSCRP